MKGEPKYCCGKRGYRTRPKAEKALRRWQAVRGTAGPVRTYRCDEGYWHLTHIPKSEYQKMKDTTPKQVRERRDLMRKVITRDGRCVVCGSNAGILSTHPRVLLTPLNDMLPSTYITSHHDCLHHRGMRSDDKYRRGYKLDQHMAHKADLYPVWNYDHWYYVNTDGTLTYPEDIVSGNNAA